MGGHHDDDDHHHHHHQASTNTCSTTTIASALAIVTQSFNSHLKLTTDDNNKDPTIDDHGLQITSFSEVVDDVTLHFQIIPLHKQSNAVSVASLIGGSSDNTGSDIARRLVLKTGLNVVLACNIPKNSPMLEYLGS